MSDKIKNEDKNFLMQYAGLGAQMLVSLGIAAFAGFKIDAWLIHFPVLVWLLPLIVLILLIMKVIKDTSKK